MRLIDADKVMEEIKRIGGHNLCEWDTIGVKALIDRQPTVDIKTEVAREIFAEIDKITFRYLNDADYSDGDVAYDLDELKNKYTKEGVGE